MIATMMNDEYDRTNAQVDSILYIIWYIPKIIHRKLPIQLTLFPHHLFYSICGLLFVSVYLCVWHTFVFHSIGLVRQTQTKQESLS